MDLAQIKDLLKIVAESGVAEVEIEEDDFKLVVRKNAPSVMMQPPPMYPSYGMSYPMGAYAPPAAGASAPAAPPPAANETAPSPAPSAQSEAPADSADEGEADNEFVIKAPIVGTFYCRPAPGEEPFVSVGDDVGQGEVLCIIEAMKLMNEIESEVQGRVKKILVEDAQPVEYDQPLFIIET